MGRLAVESWITLDFATKLFHLAGQDLTSSCRRPHAGFQACSTRHPREIDDPQLLRNIDSHNVIAKVTGSDPELKNTYVIYTAHWDHFGIGPEVNGDNIYHGAVDNAPDRRRCWKIARAYKQLRRPHHARSCLFP